MKAHDLTFPEMNEHLHFENWSDIDESLFWNIGKWVKVHILEPFQKER